MALRHRKAAETTQHTWGESSAGQREVLARLLIDRRVPDKNTILRVKSLVREIAGQPEGSDDEEWVRDFISAYLDLYLGRIAGETSLEESGLRRCLAHIGASKSAPRAGPNLAPPTS